MREWWRTSALRLAFVLGLISPPLRAATFVVTTVSDSGPGSLRQAILDANGLPAADVIAFSIPGPGIHHIAPASQLPSLDDNAGVRIDGFTQPGASPNTLVTGDDAIRLIEIDPLDFPGLVVRSPGNTIRGLRFGVDVPNGCCSAVLILAGSGNQISGNLIQGHNVGINVEAPQNQVGGTEPSDRNSISGNDVGISLFGSEASGNSIQGNFIGELRPGFSEQNFVGVSVDLGASNNLVGGVAAGAGNVISGNQTGISIQNATTTPTADTADNRIEGNLIGTDPLGVQVLANGTGVGIFSAIRTTVGGAAPEAGNLIRGFSLFGIDVVSSSQNTLEGNQIESQASEPKATNGAIGVRLAGVSSDNTVRANGIAFNGGPGIQIERSIPPVAERNALRENRIYGNGGVGIDLGTDGVTPNDVGDLDSGANQLQNFPVLTAAVSGGGFTGVQGALSSRPGETFRVEVFSISACDPSGNGEGEAFLGSTSVTTDGAGAGPFSLSLSGAVPIGSFLTATATDRNGNTSEFSTCRMVGEGSFPGVESIPTLDRRGLIALAVLVGLAGLLAMRPGATS